MPIASHPTFRCKTLRFAALFTGAAILSGQAGCIAIPVAIPQERPFIDPAAEFLVPGVTQAEEIRAAFGPPNLRAEGEWIYRNTRLGWRWAACVGAYYSGSCGVTDRGETEYFLHVMLDETGVLDEYAVMQQKDLCKARGICISGDLISLLAAESNTRESDAATVYADSDACDLYVFPRNRRSASTVLVDFERIGDLVDRDSYFYLQLQPGPHTVNFDIETPNMTGGSTELTCEGGSAHYVRFAGSVIANSVIVKQLDGARGAREIERRQRAVANNRFESVPGRVLRNGEILAQADGDTLVLYEYHTEGGVESFGTGSVRDSCGLLAALVEYELTPAGGTSALHLVNRRAERVQFAAVCSVTGNCDMPALMGDELCYVESNDVVYFDQPAPDSDSEILIVEPSGQLVPSVQEIYFDSASELAAVAQCEQSLCRISADQLRKELMD